MAPDICIVLTSIATSTDADRIAASLVEKRLAACVQISAAGLSIYRWQGRIEKEAEFYLSIKTTADKAAEVIRWLQVHHPYETPEIVTLRAEASGDYLQWMRASVD